MRSWRSFSLASTVVLALLGGRSSLAQSVSADNCSSALAIIGDGNVTNVAINCGIPEAAVVASQKKVAAQFEWRASLLNKRIAELEAQANKESGALAEIARIREENAQLKAEMLAETQRTVKDLVDLLPQIALINDEHRREEAGEALREGDAQRVRWCLAEYSNLERGGSESGYFRFFLTHVTDQPFTQWGLGGGFGVELSAKDKGSPLVHRWSGGSAAVWGGLDLSFASVQLRTRQTFFFSTDFYFGGRLRFLVNGESSVVLGAAYELPVLQYTGTDETMRAPLVGARANLGVMITPAWGLDVAYQYVADSVIYPGRANVQSLQLSWVVNFQALERDRFQQWQKRCREHAIQNIVDRDCKGGLPQTSPVD